jgi:hypothetical protein
MQVSMRPRKCVWVWNTLSQMGENVRDGTQWLPSAFPFWELHLCGSLECSKHWLKRQKKSKLNCHDIIENISKCRCLKCPRIVYLNMICMYYDQKNGWKSNWEFDFQTQIPLEHESNDLGWRHVIHCWKDFFWRL